MGTRERDKGKRRTDRYRDRETDNTDKQRQTDRQTETETQRDTGREYKYECVVRYVSEHGSIIPKHKHKRDRLGTYSNVMLQ